MHLVSSVGQNVHWKSCLSASFFNPTLTVSDLCTPPDPVCVQCDVGRGITFSCGYFESSACLGLDKGRILPRTPAGLCAPYRTNKLGLSSKPKSAVRSWATSKADVTTCFLSFQVLLRVGVRKSMKSPTARVRGRCMFF